MVILSPAHRKLRSNANLTNEEEAAVRRTMGKSLNRLKAVESETARLREKLTILGQKKKDTEDFIKVHLSPIRRLHPEILQEIFCRSLPNAHNSVFSFKEAPLLLGRVCSQWRQIAYSTPALWSSLHIVAIPLTFPGAKTRFEAFDAWLARSGILPLSISISKVIQAPIFSHQLLPYCNLLAKYARRWKYMHIHLQTEPWDPMDLPVEINVGDLPLLEVLHIRMPSITMRSLSKKDGILFAPSLRAVSLHGPSLRMLDLPVRWSQLTGLDTKHTNLRDTFKLLTLCSGLETFALNAGNKGRPFSSTTIPPSPDSNPKIVLPKLRTLKIYTAGSALNNDSFILLYHLFVPALRHFTYQLSIWPPKHTQLPEALSPLKALRSFFQRLDKPLEELDFTARGCLTRSLIEFINLLPGLKRLSLRCAYRPPGSSERSFNDQLLLGFIPHEHRSHCHSCSLVENQGEQVEVHSSLVPSSTCLCPNLEVLYVNSACFSKHVLLEYLRSRLVDYNKYNVARLRRFSITFSSGSDDDDTTGEFDKIAEQSGLLMKFKHSPAPAPRPWSHPRPWHRDPFIQRLSGF